MIFHTFITPYQLSTQFYKYSKTFINKSLNLAILPIMGEKQYGEYGWRLSG